MSELKRKRYYLCGPMSRHKNFNFDAFREAAAYLRVMHGINVINPAENFGGRQDLPWDVYLEIAMWQVLWAADELIVLPGWEESKGAQQEMAWATTKGIPVTKYEEFTGRPGPENAIDDESVVA